MHALGSQKALTVLSCTTVALSLVLALRSLRRYHRAKWQEDEAAVEDELDRESIPSILRYFQDLKLDDTFSVEEANKRRTTRYYELARDAHIYDLVPGVRSYPRLRNRREAHLKKVYKYWSMHLSGMTKSHRTVLIMCDNLTTKLLCEARTEILKPIGFSSSIETEGVWIPQASLIPAGDMHVTVAMPWWWHSVRPNNDTLTKELVQRFREALVMEFHHPFQIELERIVLLGGRTLVALWRCVGERLTPDGDIVCDRHGDGIDPFVKLRRDIVQCFTGTEKFSKRQPLTYSHRHGNMNRNEIESLNESAPSLSTRNSLERKNTIEFKTPGLGNSDGFIHTTLARLPLECLSMKDVELAPIHRLCREATATYCGHRLVVSKYRFLETTGAGGESNPCIDPIFDEYVEAPPRIQVQENGIIDEVTESLKMRGSVATIGALPKIEQRPSLERLFSSNADSRD